MRDHDADDDAGGQAFTPVGKAVAFELGIVAQRLDGCKPMAVAVGEPSEQLIAGTSASAAGRDERRLVAAQGSRAESVVVVHPLTPGDVLDDVRYGAPGTRW